MSSVSTSYPLAHCCAAPFEYPFTARAGWHAARQWFHSDTRVPPAQFRDLQFRRHCDGRHDSAHERDIRRDTFYRAFAESIGSIVIEEGRLCEAPT